ncbi:hypothetical protein I553_6495 [Mycobacterium xenopi 4042]|uniref:Uncharacterized protein n=1 Tax=Mycobacterium xenopi 4042 TaxID=1299334 RepID=X8BHT6_MYCXE|nr:hypothetical protein I553_6495 [Mycobacterium xenopi 4042]
MVMQSIGAALLDVTGWPQATSGEREIRRRSDPGYYGAGCQPGGPKR